VEGKEHRKCQQLQIALADLAPNVRINLGIVREVTVKGQVVKAVAKQ
jgi:hypothetical protein